MRRYRVRHQTEYRYGAPVTNGHTIAHLVPRPAPGQRVEACEVVADPVPDHVAQHLDGFGNVVTILGVEAVYLLFSNTQGYSNPEVDRLFEEAALALDEAKRQELYSKVQQILVEDGHPVEFAEALMIIE